MKLQVESCRLPVPQGGGRGCSFAAFDPQPSTFGPRRAFTLVEMLVVITILGILAALTVPAIKNLGKSEAATAASRQLLDAVGRARQLAIANHTTVYLVFVPPNFWNNPIYNTPAEYSAWWSGPPGLTPAQKAAVTNLCDKQLTGYAFVAYGAVGDQPGQHAWHYLAPWQALPDGTFIAEWKFAPRTSTTTVVDSTVNVSYLVQGFALNQVPFPTADSPQLVLPGIAFNYLGQLTSGQDEYIPLARGTVLPALTPNKVLQLSPPSVSEMPPGNSLTAFNLVQIDWLTGRAVLKYPRVQ